MNTEVKNTETLTKTAQQQVVLKPGFHAKQGSTVTLNIEPSGASFTPSEDYKVDQLTYDANGNIQSLRRNQSSSNGNRAMDDLTYHYNTEKPNQLQQVTDAVTASTNAGDITSQYSTENYEYNSIGQLVRNNAEGINYTYNASGLVTEVNTRYVSVQFYYNDRNQRVRKVVSRNGQRPVTTVYVRDAAGTPMAIYRNGTLVEHTVYGASRLGVYKRQGNATHKTSYELTDHLGNVRAVVSRANTSAITGTDYYPFGMPMPLRNSLSDYRYAYQGQEKDSETGKEAFELRLWDARIGRWLTTDPYGQYHSPYLGMGNDPINGIDPDGGFRTKAGRTWAWIKSGFHGKLSDFATCETCGRDNRFNIGLDGGFIANTKEDLFVHKGGFDGYIWSQDGTSAFFNGSISSADNLTNFQFWRSEAPSGFGKNSLAAHVGVELTYGTAENVYSLFTNKTFSGSLLERDNRADAALDGFQTLTGFGYGRVLKNLKIISSPKLFNSFTKSTKGVFKGATHAKLRSKAYKEMIRNHNLNAEKFRKIYNGFSDNLGRVDEVKEQLKK